MSSSNSTSPRLLALALSTALLAAAAGCTPPSYPACRNDSDCQREGRHEFCLMAHCQSCRTSADCPAGQSCNANRCEAPVTRTRPECDDAHACTAGRCESGHCVTTPLEASPSGHLGARALDGGTCTFPSPHFAFDDAVLPEDVRTEMQRTAECLQREGNTHYVLIGRADPRGTTEYNLALGARRARSVQQYLVNLGVAAPRLAVSSEGSEGATGRDEAGYANDRRVDPNRRTAVGDGGPM